MAKFKLSKKKPPLKQGATSLWYAIPSVVNRLTTRDVCEVVTRGSTTAPIEAEASFNLVCSNIPRELRLGNSVQLGDLGWLRLSFGSEGVEEPTDFDLQTMIKNVKVVFTPSKSLMTAVRKDLTFENVGIIENGFTFPSLKSYKNYKETGQLPGTGEGGEEEGGEEEGGGGSPDPM